MRAVPTEEVVSTAQAARWAAVDSSVAAIASPLAARTYLPNTSRILQETLPGSWFSAMSVPNQAGKTRPPCY
jgi:hypothetical protein